MMAVTTATFRVAKMVCVFAGKYHMVNIETERSRCGRVPMWDGWDWSIDEDDVRESRRRFGREFECRQCRIEVE